MQKGFTVGVIGNPNCGKTTLFNALTGARQHVGNWPGVTVERKTGEYMLTGENIEVVDLPGTYSLEVSDDLVSPDERIARDYVASHEADLIINIIDASNIERNLYLSTQLIEMRIPMIIVLNMMDTAQKKGIRIDEQQLSSTLGCPVISVTASTRKGIHELKRLISRAAQEKPVPDMAVNYEPAMEQAIAELAPLLAVKAESNHCDQRWLTLRLLEGDTLAKGLAGEALVETAAGKTRQIERELADDIDILTADARYDFVSRITKSVVTRPAQISRDVSNRIDQVVLNRILGIPVFLLVMYLMFMFTINIGGAFIDFFDLAAGALFVDGFSQLLGRFELPDWLIVLAAEGLGGGIQVVATFVPIVGFLFLFLSFLEDSGYMARAAFVMDRFMRLIGLPGKSFVPMIVGFGCNVPAIMATRTLENQRDRVLTNIMNPFMSCGARLPVYALFAAAFFPVGGQNIVFGLYLIGILTAVLTGLIMKHTLFNGDSAPFLMELPTYHMPTMRGIAIRTWERLKLFIVNAGRVIVPMVLVLNFLNSLGTDGSFGRENTNQSVLSEIGRHITPAFTPMGLKEDNWPAAVGIFTGVLAKEAVVGTLDALYSQLGSQLVDTGEEQDLNLAEAMLEALGTIPENLLGITENVLDPLGIDLGNFDDLASAAKNQEVNQATFAAMQRYFDGQAGAFAYLLFILLYAPCVAAIAALYREVQLGWTVFIVAWTTIMAYMAGTVFYQAATFRDHPDTSFYWFAGLLTLFLCMIAGFKLWAILLNRDDTLAMSR